MSSDYRTKIVAAVGAMTAAIRAQRALQAANLYAEVVALLPTETKKGCAYGVEFAGDQLSRVIGILNGGKISYNILKGRL